MGASCVQTDSTDKPKHELKIEETIVFVNPYETDLKASLCMWRRAHAAVH